MNEMPGVALQEVSREEERLKKIPKVQPEREIPPVDEVSEGFSESEKLRKKEFMEAAEKVKDALISRLTKKFAQGIGERPLDYHGPDHSLRVSEVAGEFLRVIRTIDPELVTEKDVVLGKLVGIAHDLVQDAEPEEAGKNLKRKVTHNELASAEELLEEMGKYGHSDGLPVFDTENKQFCSGITDDIKVTIPKFDFVALPLGDETKYPRVSQEHLSKESSLVALALASADLRGEFMKGKNPEDFFRSGNAEFREYSLAIRQDLNRGVDNISPARKAKISEEILLWKKNQVGFAKWQQILFRESVEGNEMIASSPKAEEIKKALFEMFSGFDEVINATEEESERLEKEYGHLRSEESHDVDDPAFQNLLSEMGY